MGCKSVRINNKAKRYWEKENNIGLRINNLFNVFGCKAFLKKIQPNFYFVLLSLFSIIYIMRLIEIRKGCVNG